MEVKMIRQTKPGQMTQRYNVTVNGMYAGSVRKNMLSDGNWDSAWDASMVKDRQHVELGRFPSSQLAADEIASYFS